MPNRITSNRTNYRVFHALHSLGELRQGLKERISLRPFGILEKEQIWWDIVLSQDSIRFYITLPKGEWSSWAKAKIERLWDGVVVSEAAGEDVELLQLSNQVNVCKLTLSRHNVFSMAVDRREETHPISDIVGIVDDLKADEKVRVILKMDPVDRGKWQKAAESAFVRFKNGQMPKRGGAKAKDFMVGILHVFMWGLAQGFETLSSCLPGDTIQSPIKWQREDGERAEMLVDGRLSRSTHEKANLPVFACDLYIAADAKTPDRGDTLINSIQGAFSSEMDENNEWVKIGYKPKDKRKLINGINVRWVFSDINRTGLSIKEVAKIGQLPTAGVQDLYRKQIMASEKLPIDVPSDLTSSKGIAYGQAEVRGKIVPISFPMKNKDEMVKVAIIAGESGSGKTTAIQNRALGALKDGKSVFVYEFTKRKYLEDILNALPEDFPEDHIVCLDFGNRNWPIAPDWNEVKYGLEGGWEDVLASEFWTFFSQFADDSVARTRRWMKKAALSCAEAGMLDPLNVTLMLLSKQFREQVLKKVQDPMLRATWEQWDKASDANQITMAEPILSRIDYLLDNRALKNCICQPPKLDKNGRPLVDFRKWADGDKRGPYLVLSNIPKAFFSAAGLDTMMAWMNAKEWLMTLTRGEDSPVMYSIKDEVHQIPSLAAKAEEQIVEGRKYRVGQIWSFHSMAQVEKMSPSLLKILKANNPHWHLLKSDEDAYKALRNQLEPFNIEQDLMKMERHWAVNRWHINGKPNVFMCRLNGPAPFVKDRGYLWELHSRIYGRPIADVQKELTKREMMLFQASEKKIKYCK